MSNNRYQLRMTDPLFATSITLEESDDLEALKKLADTNATEAITGCDLYTRYFVAIGTSIVYWGQEHAE